MEKHREEPQKQLTFEHNQAIKLASEAINQKTPEARKKAINGLVELISKKPKLAEVTAARLTAPEVIGHENPGIRLRFAKAAESLAKLGHRGLNLELMTHLAKLRREPDKKISNAAVDSLVEVAANGSQRTRLGVLNILFNTPHNEMAEQAKDHLKSLLVPSQIHARRPESGTNKKELEAVGSKVYHPDSKVSEKELHLIAEIARTGSANDFVKAVQMLTKIAESGDAPNKYARKVWNEKTRNQGHPTREEALNSLLEKVLSRQKYKRVPKKVEPKAAKWDYSQPEAYWTYEFITTSHPNKDALANATRLVLLGADPKTRDETGKTLKDYAKQTGNNKVLKFLEAIEKTRN